MFSKACEYGIKAMIYIAHAREDGHRRVSMGEISEEIDSPEAFTAKILQDLRKEGLLRSVKGPSGGFELDEKGERISLSHIVRAIDGDEVFTGCGLGLEYCDASNPCPVHDKFAKVRDELKHMLETTTLLELASGLKEGETILKRIRE